MKVEIYQLQIDAPGKFIGSLFTFSGECRLKDGKVDPAGYEKVYEYEAEEDVDLEDVFYIFNMEHPKDFLGHSLSVSDVVALDGKLYFCDSIGWKEMEWINGGVL